MTPSQWATPDQYRQARLAARDRVRLAPRPSDDSTAAGLRNVGLAKTGDVRSGGDRRGGSSGRRDRRQRMWSLWGGVTDGFVVCVHCGHYCHRDLVNAEGWPRFDNDKIVDGTEGGTYVVENLLPACPACNRSRARKPCGLGVPDWGDPVRNAMRVAVERGLAYDPGLSVGPRWWPPLILGVVPGDQLVSELMKELSW